MKTKKPKIIRYKKKDFEIKAERRRNSFSTDVYVPEYGNEHKNSSSLKNKDVKKLSKEFDKLNDEQIEEMRKVFNMFDLIGDGRISTVELESVLKTLGLEEGNEDNKFAENMLKMVDANGNGYILFDEFIELCIDMKMIQPISKPSFQLNPKELFKIFDYNLDGVLTLEEMQARMTLVTGERFSQQQILEMLKYIDPKNKGFVTYDDFKEIVLIGDKIEKSQITTNITNIKDLKELKELKELKSLKKWK